MDAREATFVAFPLDRAPLPAQAVAADATAAIEATYGRPDVAGVPLTANGHLLGARVEH